jgi:Na+-driven multidrug efflux pump
MRFTTPEGALSRKPFAGSVLVRLGVCTAVAFGLLVVDRPVGWGVVAGLAIFQATMLVSALISLLRFQRHSAPESEPEDV